jgi:eukaryotic-like serine/threonine-protein kinase
MRACPGDGTIQAFVGGRLATRESEAIEAHLDTCAACGGLVEGLLGRRSGSWRSAAIAIGEPTAPPSPDDGVVPAFATGDRLGRYVLLGPAGEGAQGKVFQAYDTTLDRKVALKFLTGGGGRIDTVLAEATSMARLHHPNVVTVYDAGEIQGVPFIAMELVEGQTLAEWIQLGPGQQRPSVREVVAAMTGVAHGLAAAHAAGIVHRDIKPRNILIAGDRVLVTDFGLAIADGRAAHPAGTPAYMAPEQLAGQVIDTRTDIFAFCVTLHQLLFGVLPFEGASIDQVREAMLAGRIGPQPAGREVPKRIQRLLARGLMADPALRPASMEEVATVLEADPSRSRRRVLVVTSVLLSLGAAFWGGTYLTASPERACHTGQRRIEEAWNARWRAAIGRRFGQVGLSGAWPALERRLEAYAAHWRALHSQTCSASGQRGFTPHVRDLRLACLAARRATLQVFTAALPEASAAQLGSAAGTSLPDLEGCALVDSVRPLPSDPSARARVQGIEDQLANSYRDAILGDFTRAAATAESALRAARQLGYEPLIARALNRAGAIENARGNAEEEPPRPPGAQDGRVRRKTALFEEAYAFAERGGDDLARAAAARELVAIYHNADRFPEALLWADLAAALIARLGDPPGERGALAANVGWLRVRLGHEDAARRELTRAIDLLGRAHGPEDPAVVGPRLALCALAAGTGAQLRCQREVLAFARGILGPRHPHIAAIHDNMGSRLLQRPETLDEACALLAEARRILEPVAAPRNVAVLSILTNLVSCLDRQGKRAEAGALHRDLLVRTANLPAHRADVVERYAIHLTNGGAFAEAAKQLRRCIADRRALFGAASSGVGTAVYNLSDSLMRSGEPAQALDELDGALRDLATASPAPPVVPFLHWKRGQTLLALGRGAAAREAFERSLKVHEQVGSPAPDRALSLFGLGLAEQALGRDQTALRHMEKALADSPPDQMEDPDRAEMALGLARALDRRGGRDPRICRLAREAVDLYRASSPAHARDHHRAQDFLARLTRLRRPGC